MSWFVMRIIRPVLFFPLDLLRLVPGRLDKGVKRPIAQVVLALDRPLLALNARLKASGF